MVVALTDIPVAQTATVEAAEAAVVMVVVAAEVVFPTGMFALLNIFAPFAVSQSASLLAIFISKTLY